VEKAGALDSAFSKEYDKPWFRKQEETLVNFILCYQKMFVPKKFCILKLMHIFTDGQGTFCLVFLISLVATIRMYYRNLQCRNSTV